MLSRYLTPLCFVALILTARYSLAAPANNGIVRLNIIDCDPRIEYYRYKVTCSPNPGSGDFCSSTPPLSEPLPDISMIPKGCDPTATGNDTVKLGSVGEVLVSVGSEMWFGLVRPPLQSDPEKQWYANRCHLNVTAMPVEGQSAELFWWLLPDEGPIQEKNLTPMEGKVIFSCDFGNPFVKGNWE